MLHINVSLFHINVASKKVLHIVSYQVHHMAALDLNDVPFDLNADVGTIPPNFFTQLMGEAICESPNPPGTCCISCECWGRSSKN
jgi:hypothetical protein